MLIAQVLIVTGKQGIRARDEERHLPSPEAEMRRG